MSFFQLTLGKKKEGLIVKRVMLGIPDFRKKVFKERDPFCMKGKTLFHFCTSIRNDALTDRKRGGLRHCFLF
jgi:hypothetical protein